jgi:hypothetical protein
VPRGGTMLVRQFGLLSFLVVGSITAALCAVISYQLKADLLEREWTTTADFIRTEGLQILTLNILLVGSGDSRRSRLGAIGVPQR